MGYFLFFAATVGHTVLMIRSHNWWYGSSLGRRTVDALQLLHGLLTLAGPVVFYCLFGWDPLSLFNWELLYSPGHALMQGYLFVCWMMALIVVPVVTFERLNRRCLPLLKEETKTIHIPDLLGFKPVGEGKHRAAASIPYNQLFDLDLTVKTLALPRLPVEWEGLTILHLSDLHFCGTPDRAYHERVVDLCMNWNPDIVALTGDYVDSLAHHEWLEPVLGKLKAREAKLAIVGNHDYWYQPERVREALGAMGCVIPRNSWEQIEVRGRPLVVIGNECPWLRPAPDLSNCPEDVFRLCLSHTPDNIAWAKRNRIDLMLSGHVHGGQIRFPVIGSLLVPSRYGRRYDCGVFDEKPMVLHVSRGIGGEHPLRFNCRPEAVLLVLRRDTSAIV